MVPWIDLFGWKKEEKQDAWVEQDAGEYPGGICIKDCLNRYILLLLLWP
jgi:hypothetical protein